ncbi:MAG: hypothetical protein J0L51_07085 [Rhizobiales bacterium]|nr:hypothetical protein [Hyphomicrobiales bacterium]
MKTQTYRRTREDIEWIAGRRVNEDGTIDLTEAAALGDLARGHIELVTPADTTKTPEPPEPGKKAR